MGGGGWQCPIQIALDFPSSHLAPISNHARVVLWYLRRKELREHPISNQQNQHKLSQWIIPKPPHSPSPAPPPPPPPSTSHAGLLRHPIYIFIGQLSPSLVCLGAGRSVIGGISAIL